MRKTIGILTAAILSLCFTVTTQASIVINGTRVVYPLDQKDISVHFDNRGNIPSLTQVWIDDGNRDTPIDKLNVPFIITPAMSRVEPGKGQTIRIIYTGSGTAKNEESIYWLNVLDIPGLAKKRCQIIIYRWLFVAASNFFTSRRPVRLMD
ncbi:fimbria/pilus periplasmic chaperone [Apirhabdus apintestini]|nr:fimbria/pilus periplasmic chaperone [Enterobacteriaceae bacterium CA-0114]